MDSDKMKVLGKDGQPRYEITDQVKTLFTCQCKNPKPKTKLAVFTTGTGTINLSERICANCGGAISKEKKSGN